MNHNNTAFGLWTVWVVLLWSQCAWAVVDGSSRPVAPGYGRGAAHLSQAPSAFVQLASAVAQGPASERAAFARTAILTMAEQFWQEIGRARRQHDPDPKRRRKAARWSAATLEYLDNLYATAELIDEFAMVDVLSGPGGSVQILVDGVPVVLSGPRIGDPDSLGRKIVQEYCRAHECVFDALVGHEAAWSVHDPPDDTRTGWSFRDGSGSTFETVDGIHFTFTSTRDRRRKQQAAMAFVHDLRFLAAALRDVSAEGHIIHWELVRLEATSVAGEHKVVVNQHGDFLVLRLPSLGRSATGLRSCLSWIRAWVEGRKLHQYFPRAEILLAPLLEG